MNPPEPLNPSIVSQISAVVAQLTPAHGIAAAILIAGVLFWLHGGRLIKTLFVFVAVACGALLGGTAAVGLGIPPIAGAPASMVGLIGGGLVGLIASVVLFRVAMAGCAAVSLAAIVSTLGWLVLVPPGDLSPQALASQQPSISTPPKDKPKETPAAAPSGTAAPAFDFDKLKESLGASSPKLDDLREALGRRILSDLLGTDASAPAASHAAAPDHTSRSVWVGRIDSAQVELVDRFSALEPGRRLWLLALGMSGAFVGFLSGLIMPKTAAAGISSIVGSAAIVAGVIWMVQLFSPAWSANLSQPAWVYLAVLFVLWIIGFRAQMARKSREPAKPAKAAEA
jgi:energy-converting hydrogenase Eha subunit C